jgi:enoyl-CoA hydratase
LSYIAQKHGGRESAAPKQTKCRNNLWAELAVAHATDVTGKPPAEGVCARIEGAAGVVTLDRPRALNALTTAMRAEIAAAFEAWARNPQVYAAAIVSASDRAFCAGGDVREMVAWGKERQLDARRSLAAEYALNWQLDCFAKPTVSLIDGVVMGSGVGITLYGTHRVAGERYRFAMPENRIGLFPDDGVSWAFARMPNHIGMYLALTGREIGRADAFRLGLVTHCVPAASFKDILAHLKEADPVDLELDGRHEDPGPGEIEQVEQAIARCFSKNSVRAIIAALQAERGEMEAWAQGVLGDLDRASPTSLKLTHRHVRAARALDLRATLQQDFRLACRCMQNLDFYEGVRAGLIDRDNAPVWQPARLQDVSEAMLEAHFATLGPEELQLASRTAMQAVR